MADGALASFSLPGSPEPGSPTDGALASFSLPGSPESPPSPEPAEHSMAIRPPAATLHAATAAALEQLAEATNLNEQPQWLRRRRRSRADSEGELASATLPDLDAVDFMGPAENLKRLFRMPYSGQRVSLTVHRLGRTLIVDGEVPDRDIPALLRDVGAEAALQQGGSGGGAHAGPLEAPPPPAAAEEDRARLRNLIARSQGPAPPGQAQAQAQAQAQTQAQAQAQAEGPDPDDDEREGFRRVVNWQLHEHKLVLGSNQVVFSNEEHPAVSLQLVDADAELTPCTCLDFYLDNVMANVPELALCLHRKGFVAGYKLVRTEELPLVRGADQPPLFDPRLVEFNATMLLRFLRENCTRDAATYWLYRPEGGDVLRLYDLSLLSRSQQQRWKYMVAMMCRRFAARLGGEGPKLRARQRELLGTCLDLLGELARLGGPAHETICAAVQEQVADSYLADAGPSADTVSTSVLCKAQEHLGDGIRRLQAAKASAADDPLKLAALGPQLDGMRAKLVDTCVQLARLHNAERQPLEALDALHQALDNLCVLGSAAAGGGLVPLLTALGDAAGLAAALGAAEFAARVRVTLSLLHALEARQALPASEGDDTQQTTDSEQNGGEPDYEGAEGCLLVSVRCHQRALDRARSASAFLTNKAADACNELGQFYLATRDVGGDEALAAAASWFERSAELFARGRDAVNGALVRCNLAAALKLAAQAHAAPEVLYRRAVDLCAEARAGLGDRRNAPTTWDRVLGELALTYLTMGARAGADADEAAVTDLLHRALDLYVQLGNERQVAATHFQTGAFFRRRGRDAQAERHLRRALDFYAGAGQDAATAAIVALELAPLLRPLKAVDLLLACAEDGVDAGVLGRVHAALQAALLAALQRRATPELRSMYREALAGGEGLLERVRGVRG